jgi:hypothetical protein
VRRLIEGEERGFGWVEPASIRSIRWRARALFSRMDSMLAVQVEPTRTCGDEVQLKPWMPGHPTPDAHVAMSAIFIEDQVQGFPAGELGIESFEKLLKLLTAWSGAWRRSTARREQRSTRVCANARRQSPPHTADARGECNILSLII